MTKNLTKKENSCLFDYFQNYIYSLINNVGKHGAGLILTYVQSLRLEEELKLVRKNNAMKELLDLSENCRILKLSGVIKTTNPYALILYVMGINTEMPTDNEIKESKIAPINLWYDENMQPKVYNVIDNESIVQ